MIRVAGSLRCVGFLVVTNYDSCRHVTRCHTYYNPAAFAAIWEPPAAGPGRPSIGVLAKEEAKACKEQNPGAVKRKATVAITGRDPSDVKRRKKGLQ